MAIALSGRLDFDPTVDTITAPDGTEVSLDAPVARFFPTPATTLAKTRSPLHQQMATTCQLP